LGDAPVLLVKGVLTAQVVPGLLGDLALGGGELVGGGGEVAGQGEGRREEVVGSSIVPVRAPVRGANGP
jgi:hypothetical protein